MILGDWCVLITVLVATVAVVLAGDTEITPVPTKCPPTNHPNYTVHIAHETDCTKFYTCNWGNKIEMNCPLMNKKGDRLHFNPKLQVCDWPKSAGCKNSGITKPPTEPPTNPPTKPPTEPPTKPPTKPPTEPPTKPPTKPTTVAPTTEPWTDTTPADFPDPDAEFVCPQEDTTRVTYAHPCSCERYYLCKNGDLVLRKCPNGQHWNESSDSCDTPKNANCIKKKTLNWYYN